MPPGVSASKGGVVARRRVPAGWRVPSLPVAVKVVDLVQSARCLSVLTGTVDSRALRSASSFRDWVSSRKGNGRGGRLESRRLRGAPGARKRSPRMRVTIHLATPSRPRERSPSNRRGGSAGCPSNAQVSRHVDLLSGGNGSRRRSTSCRRAGTRLRARSAAADCRR